MQTTWKVVYEGRPGVDNSNPLTGPFEGEWARIQNFMQLVCAQHPSQSPTHVITTIGRWVRFWRFVDKKLLTLGMIGIAPTVMPTPIPNIEDKKTYSTFDIGNGAHAENLKLLLFLVVNA
jgi:hypothetical protein